MAILSELKEKFEQYPVAVKVTAWYTLLIAVVFMLTMGFLLEFTDGLRVSKAKVNLMRHVNVISGKMFKFQNFDHGVYLSLYEADGRRIKGEIPDGFAAEVLYEEDSLREYSGAHETFYYYDEKVNVNSGEPEGRWLRGVISISEEKQNTQMILMAMLFIFPLFLVVAAVGGYRIVKRGFSPVETISRTVKQIGEERNLSERIRLDEGKDEIHQMAAAFNEMLDKIEKSVERERRFSSDVSHELRTPTTIIMSESEYGRDYIESVEEAKEAFQSVFQQSKRMAELINQLLELSRMENQAGCSCERLNYSELLMDVANEYVKLAALSGIILTVNVEPSVMIIGNEALLRRAAGNLLDNAIKFTKDRIELSLTIKDGWAVLTVADNGCGIDKAEQAAVWERLYQTEKSRNSSNKGCGLGLPMVMEIAKLHEGEAVVESEPGEGSVFYLRIKCE